MSGRFIKEVQSYGVAKFKNEFEKTGSSVISKP